MHVASCHISDFQKTYNKNLPAMWLELCRIGRRDITEPDNVFIKMLFKLINRVIFRDTSGNMGAVLMDAE
jgi:hypothetical protein